MPAFWHVPTGIWTIDIETMCNSPMIYVKCNGEKVSWGGLEYLDDMVTKFRRYQWASGKPDCERCGHEYFDHLENHNCELMIYDPGTPWRHGRSACNWGGGHEGCCGCKGYVAPDGHPYPSDPKLCPFTFPDKPLIPSKDAYFTSGYSPERKLGKWQRMNDYLKRLVEAYSVWK